MNLQTHEFSARVTLRRSDSILIIGNGPSTAKLAAFGFHNLPPTIDTFGMGAAYRYYRQIGWWPDYYAWCDAKVVHSHKAEFQQLIADPAISTGAFYFSLPISQHPRFHHIPHCSTGDFCFRKAVELGYRNIYLIGIEGDYVEELPESRPLTDLEYETLGYSGLFPLFENVLPTKQESFDLFRQTLRIIERTPAHNPNYFFDDYQRAGDIYSLPRAFTHRNAWRKSAEFAAQHGVNIVNLSEDSKIEQFRKSSWDQFVKLLSEPAPPAEPFSPYGRPIETPVPLSAEDRRAALAEVGLSARDKLATLVIGVRFPVGDETRVRNLIVLLDWIDHYFGDLFDVLLMEQDIVSRIDMVKNRLRPYVRHAFAYNPQAFNRGWGYNVAVRHFTEAKVVGLLDTDVLLGANFVREIIDCHTKYKAASPYTNIYYTDPEEAGQIGLTFGLQHLRTTEHIAKPTTICGGIVIVRRDAFLDVAGFEQYIEYAGEDRALDVTLLNECAPGELRIAPYTYAHLHHPFHSEPRPRAKELFAHLHNEFGCKHDKSITIMDDIHKTCRHSPQAKTRENTAKRRPTFGDRDLYRSGRPLTINGLYADAAIAPPPKAQTRSMQPEPIFPPAFKNLNTYTEKELYQAPEPDSAKLAKLYNAFKCKRCFIIGNGPSLNKHDLSLLKGEYVFAVNSFYYKTAETGFRPTFFVVEDDSVMRENIEQIRAYEAPYKFFPTNYKELHPEAANTYFFRMNRGFYEKSSPNYCVPRFSADASKVLYCGQSVTYINLQLAFFLGFTEVYLIGMDFDYVIPPEHGRKGDFIYSTTDDPNHFHKDYFGKGKTWKDPKLERVGINYRQAKVSYEAVGRTIYNATIGGKLEIFERVDYDHLLKTGVKRRPASAPAKADAAPAQKPSPVCQPPPASAPPPPAFQAPAPTAPPHEEPAPRPRAFYASFGEWLAKRSPPLFALLRMSRRAIAGAWRRRALTVPAAILLAAPLAAAFLPGFEAARPWLLGAGAFLIALATTAYVAMRMYAFALSAIAETKRLASLIGAQHALSAQLEANLLARAKAVEGAIARQKSALDAAIAGLKTEFSLRVAEVDTRTAALKRDLDQRLAGDARLRGDIEALRADGEQRAAALREALEQLASVKAAAEQREAALRGELAAHAQNTQEKIDIANAAAKAAQQSLLAELKSEIERAAQTTLAAAKKELAKERVGVGRLRERIASGERQIGALRHPSAPATLVFFGHHKCASRFFRHEVFSMIAETTGARTRKYEIADPPFHYSRMDELDLCNIDFGGLGKDGRDVVWFANASVRSLTRIQHATEDWKGLRIIRDPRQVLVSDYFHHRGDHPDVSPLGWVWDQLVKDKAILRELPEEEGLLHELNNISRQVIEEQVLAPFDDPRVMTIKIEDFSADPKGHLERIADFLGVAHIAGLDFNRTAANPESGPWRKHFTSKLREVFKERYGQALIDLGYAKDLHW